MLSLNYILSKTSIYKSLMLFPEDEHSTHQNWVISTRLSVLTLALVSGCAPKEILEVDGFL